MEHRTHRLKLFCPVNAPHLSFQDISGQLCPYRLNFTINHARAVSRGLFMKHGGMNASKDHCFSLSKSGITDPVCLGRIECSGSDRYNIKAGKIFRNLVTKSFINEGDIEQLSCKGSNHDKI